MKLTFLIFTGLLSFQITANEVFNKLDQNLKDQQFSGSVLVARGEDILFLEFYGIANREKQVPFGRETVFDIGSITKQFLSTAVLKLVEEEQLSLTDSVSKFFKNVPEDKKDLSLHQLLTHTTGLPANLSGHRLYDLVPYSTLPQVAFEEDLAFKPGSQYQYSNVGYSLLARIVEKVSGENWEQYIHNNILKPSGLEYTGYRLPKYNADQLAINYGADPNFLQRWFSIEAESRSVGHSLKHLYETPGERWFEGAGSFMSTIGDMHQWFLALRSRKLLNPESWELLFTGYADEGSHSKYGYGWAIRSEAKAGKLVTHNGSNGYSFADFQYYPDMDLFVFIATNDIDRYPVKVFKGIGDSILAASTD